MSSLLAKPVQIQKVLGHHFCCQSQKGGVCCLRLMIPWDTDEYHNMLQSSLRPSSWMPGHGIP